MTIKHQPATPLPWSRKEGHYQHVLGDDIEYFIRAANAYPKLVESLEAMITSARKQDFPMTATEVVARNLLHNLGE